MSRRNAPPIVAVLTLLLAFVAGGLAWARQQPSLYAARGQGDIYLALGDSLAWGFRLDDPSAESYPALVSTTLNARAPLETVNLAFPGETSDTFIRRQLPRAVALIREARGRGLRVSPITLNIGGNDLRSVERAGPAERTAAVAAARRNLARILDELRAAAGPTADIAVMTYYNPYGGDPGREDGEAYWVARLNQAISEEATRRGVAVADVYPAFADGRFYTHTFVLFGDVHANALGHRLIADQFVEALGYAR